MEHKVKKIIKPKLLEILIEDTNTNEIICKYPPTSQGERYADNLRCLAGIKIIKKYILGGEIYECN